MNRTHYGNLTTRTKQAYEKLCECLNKALLDPNSENFARAAEAAERWNNWHVLRKKKTYGQKSCLRWLQAGDQNTKSYHRIAKNSRNAIDMIRSLVNAQGEVLTSHLDIKKKRFLIFRASCNVRIPLLNIYQFLPYRIC